MALRTPPSWLQQGSHPAENDRLTMQGIVSSTGILGGSSLAVTAQASPNMTVNVAAGWGAIVSSTANAGVYQFYNDAVQILNITTADATNPRVDRIVATVSDAYYSGSTNDVAFQVIAGTPAASPTAPAIPSNSVSLATIAVAANTTTISSANITDTRVQVSTNLFSSSSYVDLNTAQTIYRKTLVSPQEITTVSATAATGTVNFDALTQADLYYTTNATANFTLNFRGSSGSTLNSILPVGSTVTLVFRNTNGSTAYRPTVFQIDGSAVTPKWQGGAAPTAGSASAVDVYTFAITKTASTPTYQVFASQTKFA